MKQSESRKKLHFYTDCPYFGGCENMLSILSDSKELSELYEMHFHYRYSALYASVFKKRVKSNVKSSAVRKLYSGAKVYSIKNRNLRGFFLVITGIVLKYLILFWNIMVLFFHFRRYSIDVLHINNGGYPAAMSCNAAVIVARILGIKKICYVVNNQAVNYRNPMRWLDRPIDFIVKKLVSTFITGSKSSSRVLKEVLKLEENKIRVINNGIKIRGGRESIKLMRAKLKLNENKLCAGIVAAHDERKGHIYCFQAYKQLLEKAQEPPILFVEGEGFKTASLKKYVAINKLESYIHFIGNVPNIYDFYNMIDFLILPSISYEDFPNVIIEAMACGKPVIGTNIAGIPEQILNDVNGYVVEPRDSAALAASIMSLTTDAALRKCMGDKSRSMYMEKYTPEVAVNNYCKFYSQMLEVQS